jgi:hypothetical protein
VHLEILEREETLGSLVQQVKLELRVIRVSLATLAPLDSLERMVQLEPLVFRELRVMLDHKVLLVRLARLDRLVTLDWQVPLDSPVSEVTLDSLALRVLLGLLA